MKKVLVTGISGFVGQHCAAELLKKGYAVKGSVRSLSRIDEVLNGIKKEIDPKGNLEFCELDLMKDAGWDDAMEGCDYVLHVASPFVVKVPKDENELIKPAVEGTLRALEAAKKAGVKRIVLTSSTVAMHGGKEGLIKINQDSWTDVNAKNVTAYFKSKTIAENSAWDFIKNQTGENKLELVVVNPGPIYGPTLTGNLATEAMDFFNKLITGKVPMLPRAYSVMSDVRDVATIHVSALENEKANGKRFIVTSEKPHAIQVIAQILKSNGYDKVSTRLAPTFLLKFIANFNSEIKGMLPFVGNTIEADVSDTMKTFNWKPIPFEKTVLDTAKSVEKVINAS
ncbi:MAG: NAD-dependent epimerase/dehydratase family protein [Bacteroidetes bacterium]|jgi:dihydroflavonol-4-reductase|nr:NAD-dependent epimerase/dehydratase family protein [Bacteroidota bacterium]